MTDLHAVAKHYGRPGLADVILDALKAAGKDIDHLTPDDLAPVDEFHTRGRAATVELAQFLELNGSERILDVGCGIGGPSRYLAKTFGCRVVGVDLTPEFCRVATMLAERTGLSDKVQYRQGNALAMPFEDLSFDVVWSQNVVMNIADRNRLYWEIHRVLRPADSSSGLGLHLLLGEDGPAMYRNGFRNYSEGRIGLVQGLAVRAG